MKTASHCFCVGVLLLTPFFQNSFLQAQEQENPYRIGCQAGKADPANEVSEKEVVVVTGTLIPVPLGEVNRSVSAIQIAETPVPYNHWIDALRWDPSIDLRQRAPNDVQLDVSIRGSSFGETLIMVNGLRMDDAQSGHHDSDLPLPTESLARIEVLRGAGSTLYGSDAMGGAVNFIASDPKHSEIRVGAGVGNFGINQQSLAASFVTHRWGEQLSVARDFSSGFAPDRDYRSLTIFSATDGKSALGRTHVMLGSGDKPYGADQFYGPFNSWERTKTWFAGLTQDIGAATEVDIGYRRHSDEFALFRNRPQIYENNHITESWQVILRRQEKIKSNLTLLYGGEGNHDVINSNNLGHHMRSRGAVYVDLDMRTLRRLSFSIGAREEIFDSYGPQLTPTAAASVWLKAGWKFKASASRAFRLPTYTDLYYEDPANVGSPNLKPESAWNYEGGLEWNPGGRWKTDLTVFHLREHNVIDYVRYFPSDLFHAANIQRLNFTGVEANAELRVSNTQRLTVGYTGLHGAQEALSRVVSKYVFNYPIHNAIVGWQGQLPLRIQARTRVNMTDRFARDPFAVWDADFGREFGNLGVRLSLSNLSDTEYEEIEGVRMPGRAVVFGLEYAIKGKGK